jgi:hypothetical protein
MKGCSISSTGSNVYKYLSFISAVVEARLSNDILCCRLGILGRRSICLLCRMQLGSSHVSGTSPNPYDDGDRMPRRRLTPSTWASSRNQEKHHRACNHNAMPFCRAIFVTHCGLPGCCDGAGVGSAPGQWMPFPVFGSTRMSSVRWRPCPSRTTAVISEGRAMIPGRLVGKTHADGSLSDVEFCSSRPGSDSSRVQLP